MFDPIVTAPDQISVMGLDLYEPSEGALGVLFYSEFISAEFFEKVLSDLQARPGHTLVNGGCAYAAIGLRRRYDLQIYLVSRYGGQDHLVVGASGKDGAVYLLDGTRFAPAAQFVQEFGFEHDRDVDWFWAPIRYGVAHKLLAANVLGFGTGMETGTAEALIDACTDAMHTGERGERLQRLLTLAGAATSSCLVDAQ